MLQFCKRYAKIFTMEPCSPLHSPALSEAGQVRARKRVAERRALLCISLQGKEIDSIPITSIDRTRNYVLFPQICSSFVSATKEAPCRA